MPDGPSAIAGRVFITRFPLYRDGMARFSIVRDNREPRAENVKRSCDRGEEILQPVCVSEGSIRFAKTLTSSLVRAKPGSARNKYSCVRNRSGMDPA